MALIRGIDTSASRRSIVKGLMQTCLDMGIEVIGEGIETAAERDVLMDLGVRLMQGHFFSRPAFRSVAAINAVLLDVR